MPPTLDVASRLAAIAAGRRRVSPLPTMVVALVVTALVVIPFTEWIGRSAPAAADPSTIVVGLLDTEPMGLDGATLAGPALISIDDDRLEGVSFAMYPRGENTPILASQDLSGPTFSPRQSASGADQPMDTTLLSNGVYDLFVTIATARGEQRTAVTFQVANP